MNPFKQLHIKFLIILIVAVGTLLAVTLGAIFIVSYTTRYQDIYKQVDDACLYATSYPSNSKSKYIVFEDNALKTTSGFDFFNDSEKSNICSSLINTSIDDFDKYYKLSTGDYHFCYKVKEFVSDSNTNMTVYCMVETTEQVKGLYSLGSTLIIVFAVAMIFIAVLSYFLARSAMLPVKEAFEKEKDLVANASHELKTPLTVARTNLELVASDPNATIGENMKWIESARYQIDRMNNLILQMLELSKMERPDYVVQKSDINISDVIEGVLLSFEAGCYERNIRFVSEIQPNIIYSCNHVEMEKLITILVDNALKYTQSGGEICVTMAKTLKLISIKVTNTGDGIPQEKLGKIFDRFYKLDESHRESGNSFGLGLSIAKLISTSMGGDIKCFSEVGKYTTFEITLPIR